MKVQRGDMAYTTIAGQSIPVLVLTVEPQARHSYDLVTVKVAVPNALTGQPIIQVLPTPIPSTKLTQRYSKVPGLDPDAPEQATDRVKGH